mmetsp:Transcript_6476/g.18103  ORF Transcript_6476/g.18103 Transcript_6476/m.18103 type:complete len:288 (+) Transcript_6476:833-1696(+)
MVLLNLRAKFVVVLEQGKVLLLCADKIVNQIVDVADARGSLDFPESFLVTGHLLLVYADAHPCLRSVPRVLRNRFPVLLFLSRRLLTETTSLAVPNSNLLPHVLLHLLVVVDEPAQLAPLLLELRLFPVGLLLQRGHLRLCSVPRLVRCIGLLDDRHHLVLPLLQLLLVLPVDGIEDHPLATEGVNLIAEAFVCRNGLVELLQSLVQAILQGPNLFLHLGTLGRSTDTTLAASLLPDRGDSPIRGLNLLYQLLQGLNLAVVLQDELFLLFDEPMQLFRRHLRLCNRT